MKILTKAISLIVLAIGLLTTNAQITSHQPIPRNADLSWTQTDTDLAGFVITLVKPFVIDPNNITTNGIVLPFIATTDMIKSIQVGATVRNTDLAGLLNNAPDGNYMLAVSAFNTAGLYSDWSVIKINVTSKPGLAKNLKLILVLTNPVTGSTTTNVISAP